MIALTAQQVFDNALFNLREQKVPSMSAEGTSCAYRGQRGARCGIGWSIPDEVYEPFMDAGHLASIRSLMCGDLNDRHVMHRAGISALRFLFGGVSVDFLADVQEAHDVWMESPPSCAWEDQMGRIAAKFRLHYEP